MTESTIIFLNGCGSAGKTSIAKSIQHLSPVPYLRLGVDTFIDILPNQYVGFGEKAKDEGYYWLNSSNNQRGPTMEVNDGPLGAAYFTFIPHVIRQFAIQHPHIIVDEVILDMPVMKAYLKELRDFRVYCIGVYCDLEKMIERETLREDRAIGLSNDQYDRVHQIFETYYDLRVDTSILSPFNVAREILTFVEKTPAPVGFKKMEQCLQEGKI